MRRMVFTALAAIGLALGGVSVTSAQASVAHPASPMCGSQLADLIENSLGYMQEQPSTYITTTLTGGATFFCSNNGGKWPSEIQIAGDPTRCLYIDAGHSDELYIHTCNASRPSDLWTYWRSGCLSNDYTGYDNGTGDCASGYPLNNIVNMYPWNGTGPEVWNFYS